MEGEKTQDSPECRGKLLVKNWGMSTISMKWQASYREANCGLTTQNPHAGVPEALDDIQFSTSLPFAPREWRAESFILVGFHIYAEQQGRRVRNVPHARSYSAVSFNRFSVLCKRIECEVPESVING